MVKSLNRLLEENKRKVAEMLPKQIKEMLRQQGESWAKAEASSKPKYKWVNGVKVYDSYEDYCND